MIGNIVSAIIGMFITLFFLGSIWIGHQIDIIRNKRDADIEIRLLRLQEQIAQITKDQS